MITIKPQGSKLIVKPLPSEDETTEGGIITQDLILERAEVIEVGDEFSGKYKSGDIVLYPKGSGQSMPKYKKMTCIWLDARSPDMGGDCWGRVIE